MSELVGSVDSVDDEGERLVLVVYGEFPFVVGAAIIEITRRVPSIVETAGRRDILIKRVGSSYPGMGQRLAVVKDEAPRLVEVLVAVCRDNFFTQQSNESAGLDGE